eukprot:106758_1
MWNSKDVVATEKPRTSVLFDNTGIVQGCGNHIMGFFLTSFHNEGWKLFERFKMNLYDAPSMHSEIISAAKARPYRTVNIKDTIAASLGNGEESSEIVFVACLKQLKAEAKRFINVVTKKQRFKQKNFKVANDEIKWILAVPSIWSEKGKQKMKDWA